MKKVVIFGAIMALTMFFGMQAVAQEISCPPCKGFNYTKDSMDCDATEQEYCDPEDIRWDEFVFPICNCPDVDVNFAKGSKIGVRMHILTPGVYWADDDGEFPKRDWENDGIDFTAYDSNTNACEGVGETRVGTFSQIWFYPDDECDSNDRDTPDNHYIDGELLNQCSWNVIDFNKLTSLSTDINEPTAFFTIPMDFDSDGNPTGEENWAGFTYWKFNTGTMPMIRIDTEEVLAANLRGEPIQIRVEFVRATDEGICIGDCLVVCECIIEVKMLCTPEEGCIYFPYVLTQRAPWVTGIALSNVGGNIPISDMVADFTLVDMGNNEYTYTKDDFESAVWSNVLDNMLDEFDGTPMPGNAMLKIKTNFYADGYQFITDGVFGGSSLARECDFLCDTAGCNQ